MATQIRDYIDAAKAAQGFKTDTQVARALRLTQGNISCWRTKRWWPDDASMIKLAAEAKALTGTA